MTYVLGVDLGTTFTAAAVGRDGSTEMATLGNRDAAVPSVVLVRDDRVVLVGEAAEARARQEPDRVARAVKRRLGDTTPIILGGQPHPPASLMAHQLADVVRLVHEREGEPPAQVALTHPATWGPFKLDQLRQVARLAGLPPDRVLLVPEPVAAAVAHAHQRALPDGVTLAVYDFGGGTFDATVVRVHAGTFEVLGVPEGVEHLGGLDVDAAVLDHVLRTALPRDAEPDADDPGTQAAFARLREECVRAKEVLSADTDVTIPVLLPGITTEVRLTRVELERMISPLVDQTIAATRRALAAAAVQPEQLHAVLLVGGSSRIPVVAQQLTAALGRPVAVDAHPKHAVATGAALQAWAATSSDAPAPVPVVGVEPAAPAPAPSLAAPPPPLSAPVTVHAAPGVEPTVGSRRARTRPVGVAAAALLFAVAVAATALAVTSGDGGADVRTGGDEIVAEPAGSVGEHPFTTDLRPDTGTGALAAALSPAAGDAVGVELGTVPVSSAPGTTPSVPGDTPGLYGGTPLLAVCDRDLLVDDLAAHPEQAAAWGDVLTVPKDAIADYVAGLTDVVLQADTRVTNHRHADGETTSFQAVLQAGTAVLVDDRGVPRVRCAGGNPLTPPVAATEPRYAGTAWDGFDPGDLVVVVAAGPVSVFELDDLTSDATLLRAAGSDAAAAQPADVATVASSTTTSTVPSLARPDDLTTKGTVLASSVLGPGSGPELAIDGDVTTGWLSAGPSPGVANVGYVWESALGPLAIDEVHVVGNAQLADPSLRTGTGFGNLAVRLLGEQGQVVWSQVYALGGTPDPDIVAAVGGVTASTVTLSFSLPEDPVRAGFAELRIIARPG